MKKILLTFLISVLAFFGVGLAHANESEVKSYLTKVLHEGYDIFDNKKTSLKQKTAQSANIVRKTMYFEWMAKAALGRHKKNLSAEKIQDFSRVYKDFIITTYSELSSAYNGQRASIKSVRKISNNMYIAKTEIYDGGSTTKAEYLVHKTSNSYKIGDIITEGISILNSQQSEFNSVISSKGIDALISDLKKRINRK